MAKIPPSPTNLFFPCVICDAASLLQDFLHFHLIQCAQQRDCDLIVMSSHGKRGLQALLIGSETHKVLTHSTIPVLVFR